MDQVPQERKGENQMTAEEVVRKPEDVPTFEEAVKKSLHEIRMRLNAPVLFGDCRDSHEFEDGLRCALVFFKKNGVSL